MADSVTGGLTFLWDVLANDPAFMGYVTGVFTGVAPEGTKPDYCILQPQSPTDVNTATAVRIFSRNLYQVKIAGPVAHYSNISAAYARADQLLQPNGQPLRNTNGIIACFRQNGLYVPEVVGGIPYVNLGGLYRIEL